MEIEFIPYAEALELKELGFNEPCFGGWAHPFKNNKNGFLQLNQECEYDIKAPTFSQAFRWFREEHSIYGIILPSYSDNKAVKDRFFYEVVDSKKIKQELEYHTTHEEAELVCLRKLIEIIKEKQL